MRVASMFSGIGGIDLGFQQAGFDIVWANEMDHDAAVTYRNNFGDKHLVEGDIRKVDIKTMPDFDVLVAGFPCQPFSIAGKQKGFEDPRGNLFFEIAKVIDIKRPEVVFLENVANLVEHDNGKTFLVIYNTLVQFGYYVKYKVLDAKFYANIPQQRKRIFIVAFLDYAKCAKYIFPEEIERTCQINDIIDRHAKHDDCYYYSNEHVSYEELCKIVTDRESVYRFYNGKLCKCQNNICTALTASMGTMKDKIPIIVDDFGIRKITPYECLALQGYPDTFKFQGISLNSAYKQCGNSVVVPLIKRLAEKIKGLYE